MKAATASPAKKAAAKAKLVEKKNEAQPQIEMIEKVKVQKGAAEPARYDSMDAAMDRAVKKWDSLVNTSSAQAPRGPGMGEYYERADVGSTYSRATTISQDSKRDTKRIVKVVRRRPKFSDSSDPDEVTTTARAARVEGAAQQLASIGNGLDRV